MLQRGLLLCCRSRQALQTMRMHKRVQMRPEAKHVLIWLLGRPCMHACMVPMPLLFSGQQGFTQCAEGAAAACGKAAV